MRRGGCPSETARVRLRLLVGDNLRLSLLPVHFFRYGDRVGKEIGTDLRGLDRAASSRGSYELPCYRNGPASDCWGTSRAISRDLAGAGRQSTIESDFVHRSAL